MSFYSSSSFISSTNSAYSNSSHSLSNKSSFYNDMYRSYSNIPKYVPVTYSILRRPSYFELKKSQEKPQTSSVVALNSKHFYNSESNLNMDDGRRSQTSFDDMTKSVVSIEDSGKEDSFITKSTQNDSKEFVASALSNVQLSLTDDLTTQVDYYLNEIDYRMICSGRQVEVESFELSTKSGLLSKCIYLNGLLSEAKMNESLLDCDPVFTKNGKGILVFINKKDAEEFTRFHSRKFSTTFSNNSDQEKLKNFKKNVTFGETQTKDLSNRSQNTINSISTSSLNDRNANINPSDVLISSNSSKKNKSEGYEILTIKAKLKQRIGQHRSKQVTLNDIDSIMRNVVTIIQDEFMKRFPSAPSASISEGRN